MIFVHRAVNTVAIQPSWRTIRRLTINLSCAQFSLRRSEMKTEESWWQGITMV
jgi:hypothetical protein